MNKRLLKCALFLLCICFASCSDDSLLSQVTPKKNVQQEDESSLDPSELLSRYNQIDVNTYLFDKATLFGHPLVFNSAYDVDDLLGYLSNLEYWRLRDWSNRVGIHNDILESIITYDSVYYDVAYNMGYDLTNPKDLENLESHDDDMAYFIRNFAYIMATEHYDMCISTDSITPHGDTIYMVQPLGNLDYEALCNEHHLFLVDKVVYKVMDGYLLTCPMDKYEFLSDEHTSYPEGIYAQFEQNSNYIDSLEYCLAPYNNGVVPPPLEAIPPFIDPTIIERSPDGKTYTATKGDRVLQLYVTSYPAWWWGHTRIYKSSTCSNFYGGTKFKARIRGDVKFMVDVIYKQIYEVSLPYSVSHTSNRKKYKSFIRLNNEIGSWWNLKKITLPIRDLQADLTQDNTLTLKIEE